ncbi:MAG: hemerythrin family protein [Thermoanaerobaculia bacterium]
MTPAEERQGLITGNREMDGEHVLQLHLLRELVQNLDAGDVAAAAEVFESLDHFTSAHFLAEELLMRLHAYPDFEAHAGAHAGFVGELKSLAARLSAGADETLREEVDAFARRLLAHIATADHALGEFQRTRGIAAP